MIPQAHCSCAIFGCGGAGTHSLLLCKNIFDQFLSFFGTGVHLSKRRSDENLCKRKHHPD